VYKEFDATKHVVKPFAIPADWVRFGGIDFGHTNPTAVLSIAKEPEKRDKDGKVISKAKFYVYREFYKSQPLLAEITTFLQADSLQYVLGDPSSAQEISEIRRYHGFTKIEPAENNIEVGIERIRSLLQEDRILFFDGRCPNTLREFSMYHHKAPNEDRAISDKPVAVNNHAMDALKYAFSRDITGLYTKHNIKAHSRDKLISRKIIHRFQDSFTGY
jgi:phage terminase large subunit